MEIIDFINAQIFGIPENIIVREDPDGTEYENHLLTSEASLIKEESDREDFVCWLRNPAKVHGRFACLVILAAKRNPSIRIS